jgi:RNA polymerase sigma factor (sigma-70 family)
MVVAESPHLTNEAEVSALIALLRDEPSEGLVLLLERYGGLIRHAAGPFAPTTQDREDLYHEVALQLLRQGGEWFSRWDPARSKFSTFLFLVVWRFCRDCRKKIERQRRHIVRAKPAREEIGGERAPVANPRTEAALTEAATQLRACFEQLLEAGTARKQDWLLVMMRAEGCTAREVGELLGVSEEAVHQRYHRLRGRLSQCLEKHGFQSIADLVSDSSRV